MESLQNYKTTAEAYKPEPPQRKQLADPDSLISFDGKDYISAGRAAKITGYHQDYVGQLARSGTILSRQVGNRWYVERDGILGHKKEKDALLAAVQSESVGLRRVEHAKTPSERKETGYGAESGFFTYTMETADLMPVLKPQENLTPHGDLRRLTEREKRSVAIPVRVMPRKEILHHTGHVKRVKPARRIHGKTIFYGTAGTMAFTIVIVLMFGFSTVGKSSMYAATAASGEYTSGLTQVFTKMGDFLEDLIVPQLSYKRG